MIIKKFVYKDSIIFRRVKYNREEGYLCGQYKCRFRDFTTRSDNPICDLCSYIRHKFAHIKNLYIPVPDQITC